MNFSRRSFLSKEEKQAIKAYYIENYHKKNRRWLRLYWFRKFIAIPFIVLGIFILFNDSSFIGFYLMIAVPAVFLIRYSVEFALNAYKETLKNQVKPPLIWKVIFSLVILFVFGLICLRIVNYIG